MKQETKNKRGKGKKMGNVGRPSKKLKRRGRNNSNDHDTASITHSFSSVPACPSSLDTRWTLSIQNVDENPSETSTLMLVKQILLEESNLNPDSIISKGEITPESYVQAEKQILKTATKLSPSSNIPLNELLPKLPVQAQGAAETADRTDQICDPIPSIPRLALEKTLILLGDKSCENDEIASQPKNAFVDAINGYKVKEELVPLLEAIFSKYGDIAKYSSFSEPSRSFLLEMVCSIYHQLEVSNFKDLTYLELQSMLDQVRDLEFVNIEVGWLRNRLDQILRIRNLGASTVKDLEERNTLVIQEKKKAVENYEMQLETSLFTTKELQARLKQEKEELAAVVAEVDQIKYFYEGSLVHGLI